MGIVSIIFMGYILTNVILTLFLVKRISHPKYSLSVNDYEDKYAIMILFLGFGILLFKDNIYRKRLKEYYEYADKHRSSIREFGVINGVEITEEEINNLGRALKIEEINYKIKKQKS